MKIGSLDRNQLFHIVGDPNKHAYKYHGSWLDDGFPWQYQYQNMYTKEITITSQYIDVEPVKEVRSEGDWIKVGEKP